MDHSGTFFEVGFWMWCPHFNLLLIYHLWYVGAFIRNWRLCLFIKKRRQNIVDFLSVLIGFSAITLFIVCCVARLFVQKRYIALGANWFENILGYTDIYVC